MKNKLVEKLKLTVLQIHCLSVILNNKSYCVYNLTLVRTILLAKTISNWRTDGGKKRILSKPKFIKTIKKTECGKYDFKRN